MSDYIKREWRCEQMVAGEWVEVPHDDLTIVNDINQTPRLLRGDREVGGAWRMFMDGQLAYTWMPWTVTKSVRTDSEPKA